MLLSSAGDSTLVASSLLLSRGLCCRNLQVAGGSGPWALCVASSAQREALSWVLWPLRAGAAASTTLSAPNPTAGRGPGSRAVGAGLREEHRDLTGGQVPGTRGPGAGARPGEGPSAGHLLLSRCPVRPTLPAWPCALSCCPARKPLLTPLTCSIACWAWWGWTLFWEATHLSRNALAFDSCPARPEAWEGRRLGVKVLGDVLCDTGQIPCLSGLLFPSVQMGPSSVSGQEMPLGSGGRSWGRLTSWVWRALGGRGQACLVSREASSGLEALVGCGRPAPAAQ